MTMDEMRDEFGSTTEEILGEERHVTVDEKGRSVIGPRRHASKPRRWFRGRTRATQQDAETITTGEVRRVIVPEGESFWSRARWAVLSRFYDEQWHKAVQHTAADLMMWALGLSMAAIFLKGAYWVVTL